MRTRWLLLGLVVAVVLVPAVVITAARVVQPAGGTWVRLVSFTPYAFVLYGMALLLLLVAWAAGRGRWRTGARALSVVALAGVALHGYWLSGSYVGAPAEAASVGRLRVMTLNLMLGQATPSRVVELVVANDVDVLVLQEVDAGAFAALQGAGVGEPLPHVAGLPEEGPAGTMVLANQPLTEVTRLGTGFSGYEMTFDEIVLLAVHPRPPVGDAVEWTDDHRVIRQAAQDRGGSMIIAGDLNATSDHAVLHDLADTGFDDAASAARSGWQPTWPADGQVVRLGVPVASMLALDHVLVSDDLTPVSTESVTVDGTDHRAVIVVLAR